MTHISQAKKSCLKRSILLVLLLSMLMAVLGYRIVYAQSIPTNITITMYVLTSGGARSVPITLCTANSPLYGCAANGRKYPWSTSTVTIPIDGVPQTASNGTMYQYLRDVVTQEMGPAQFHATAIRAQAVAARTYVYNRIQNVGTINNSAEYQVFVPGTYQNIAGTYGSIIDAAVSPRQYMTQPNDQYAIFSEFGADVPTLTVANPPYPYLISVAEPISSQPQDGHGHGMSQHGASRWARGNETSNINDTGTPWSVTMSQPFQILTHYYTGIHIRDANNPSAILTSTDRWAPMWLRWNYQMTPPTYVCKGMTYNLVFAVQNTGTTTWYASGGDKYSFEYEIVDVVQAANVPAGATNRPTSNVLPGKTFVASQFVRIPSNLPGSSVKISFDMKKNGTMFSQMGWYEYSLGNLRYGTQDECKYRVHFPSMRYPPQVQGWWPK